MSGKKKGIRVTSLEGEIPTFLSKLECVKYNDEMNLDNLLFYVDEYGLNYNIIFPYILYQNSMEFKYNEGGSRVFLINEEDVNIDKEVTINKVKYFCYIYK